MECKEQGMTRFMYTKIPMFKEIILSSFYCDHCGFKNTEVQFGGKLSDTGVSYVLKVVDQEGLNRSIVKSEFATIKIPELDFEIPPQTQKGSIKTVEGFLRNTIEGISELQEERRRFDPKTAAQIDAFLEKATEYMEGKVFPFTFTVTDPSGNSFVQNPDAPKVDPHVTKSNFMRSVEDYQTMGYSMDANTLAEHEAALIKEGVLPEISSPSTAKPSANAQKTTKEE